MKFSRIFRGNGQREFRVLEGEGIGGFLGNEERGVAIQFRIFVFNGDSQEFLLH